MVTKRVPGVTASAESIESAAASGCQRIGTDAGSIASTASRVPAIAITALFSFMTAWNEFILAATFMDQESMYTAPVGLRFFVGGFSSQWGFFAAGSVIVSLPVVILFLFTRRIFFRAMIEGAVKG